MARTPNPNGFKRLSATEKRARIAPARLKLSEAARKAALRKATSSVSAKVPIDFVRSVRGK